MLLLLLSVFSLVVGVVPENPVVTSPLGAVEGSILTTRKGREFQAFRGIRYAKAPVGELRFKPPVPVEPWDDVYDATEDGPQCTQPGSGPESSEDCLFLNVYTQQVNASDLRPVLVFIHAGGFYSWSGLSTEYGPDYLLDHNIVLVTLNHRLATLGFLSTGDEYSPGNYGMKDQVEVLRWIQKNIASFGGDPDKVTIGGYSAGATSVMLHMISPMSKGLFHQGIAMSGSAASNWAINKDPLSLAKKQALNLGCPTNTTEALVNCIKDLPAQKTANIYSKLWSWGYDPIVVLSPVVEPDLGDGQERFLTKDPTQALAEGDFQQVPIIIGTTKDEFTHRAIFVVQNDSWAADMSERWNEVAPIPFMYEPDGRKSQALRQYYLGSTNESITMDSFWPLGRMYADSVIIFGSLRGAELISKKSSAPVYLYQFTYQGNYSYAYWPDTQTPYGVVHHDDLIYLFPSAGFPKLNTTGPDAEASDRNTLLWANFVQTGNPTPPSSTVTWPRFSSTAPKYLDIGSKLVVKNGTYYPERIAVWNSLFPV